ncbi:hypothetical protein K3495_g9840 [Podosphaera aphanis]|nr:hypothetical protein K3495_g9840 [Podosphaera aphanis]
MKDKAIKIFSTKIDDGMMDDGSSVATQPKYPFFSETFDPKKETISAHRPKLAQYQTKLAGTARVIIEKIIYYKIIGSVPKGESWESAGLHCLNNNLGLDMFMINFYNIHAPITLNDTANFAKGAPNTNRGISRGQSRRGRGKGDRFGPYNKINFNGNASGGKNHRSRASGNGLGYKGKNFDPSYRGRPNNNDYGNWQPNNSNLVICNFYGKRGHQQGVNCFLFTRYQRESHGETRANVGKAQLAIKYNSSNYLSPRL